MKPQVLWIAILVMSVGHFSSGTFRPKEISAQMFRPKNLDTSIQAIENFGSTFSVSHQKARYASFTRSARNSG